MISDGEGSGETDSASFEGVFKLPEVEANSATGDNGSARSFPFTEEDLAGFETFV